MAISAYLLFASGLVVLVTLATPGLAARQSNGIGNVVQSKLALANNEFAFDVYRKIAKSSLGKNVVLSPVSISVALAMISAGAGGATKSQIAAAMHLNDYSWDDDAVNKGFKYLVQTFNRPDNNYTLQMANRLYAHSGHEFVDKYLRTTDEYYMAKLEALDFVGDSEGARKIINNWVAKMTSNKVKELFPKGSISQNSVLVLVNAVYLKASWLYKFHRKSTSPEAFHLSKKKKIKVPMMRQRNSNGLGYTNSVELGCHVLDLPYIGDKISMLVFLPHKIDGLSSLEGRLGTKSLGDVFRALYKFMHVHVSLPKFVFEQQLDLKETLAKVGIKDLFDSLKANLSGIEDIHNLAVSAALHKANIVVNEEGTEGAAASGFDIVGSGIVPSSDIIVNFIVNRPFMFLLVERTTGSILFLGRVTNPTQVN